MPAGCFFDDRYAEVEASGGNGLFDVGRRQHFDRDARSAAELAQAGKRAHHRTIRIADEVVQKAEAKASGEHAL